jgi:hypothetical protein
VLLTNWCVLKSIQPHYFSNCKHTMELNPNQCKWTKIVTHCTKYFLVEFSSIPDFTIICPWLGPENLVYRNSTVEGGEVSVNSREYRKAAHPSHSFKWIVWKRFSLLISVFHDLQHPWQMLGRRFLLAAYYILSAEENMLQVPTSLGARDSVVASGTMLQAWRSQVRFPIRQLYFSIVLILPAALWPWGRLSL